MADRISGKGAFQAINESPHLRRRAKPDNGPARGPANVNRRTVGNGVVYFVGSEQETQFSGIDADVVICDEFDLMKEDTLSLIQSRIRSSRAGRVFVTSTPTVESFGVSHLYANSDALRYELLCRACGTWQTPEFPGSIDWEQNLVVC
ncbi:MAG: phage terminase large subunit family protein [Dehalococcoidia bacterium]|nr:phage terminase large subunit family protein [Dehalococcoidia bacterium]